jgi:hypothetical protein
MARVETVIVNWARVVPLALVYKDSAVLTTQDTDPMKRGQKLQSAYVP